MKSAARSFSMPVFLSLILIAPLAFAGPRVVNCDKGDSLQKAEEDRLKKSHDHLTSRDLCPLSRLSSPPPLARAVARD